MKPEARRCKCLHCQRLFVPDYRNRGRQKYCSTLECQQASKRARQQRWLSKPENRDHFRGAENVQRVQEWRRAHPGYWKRSPRKAVGTLQDDIVLFVRRLIAKGQDILDQPSSRSTKENTIYDEQKDPAPGPFAASAGAV